MFEEVSSNPALDVDGSQPSSASPSSQASVGADELMDRLFHDLEIDLDNLSSALTTTGDERLGHALLEGDNQGLSRHQSAHYPGDDLLVPYTPLDSTLTLREELEASLNLGLVPLKDKNQLTRKRLLMASACVALVGISSFWLGRQLRLQHAPVAAASQSAVVPPQVSSDTVAFADYVSQSLERINQETKAAKLAAAQAKTQPRTIAVPKAGLPSLPKVGVASSNATSVSNNVERVYVPVAEVPTLQAQPAP